MRLKFLTLALAVGIFSNFNPAFSDHYEDLGEYELKKERGRQRYQRIQKRKNARRVESNVPAQISVAPQPKRKFASLADDSDEESVDALPKQPTAPEFTDEPFTLIVNSIKLPTVKSKKGKTIIFPEDPLEVTITLADGKSYEFGSGHAEIALPGFKPEGNRSFARFDVEIKDLARHLIPAAQSFLYKNNKTQSLRRCRFSLSHAVSEPTIDIVYDKGSRRFFADGLWPTDRRFDKKLKA